MRRARVWVAATTPRAGLALWTALARLGLDVGADVVGLGRWRPLWAFQGALLEDLLGRHAAWSITELPAALAPLAVDRYALLRSLELDWPEAVADLAWSITLPWWLLVRPDLAPDHLAVVSTCPSEGARELAGGDPAGLAVATENLRRRAELLRCGAFLAPARCRVTSFLWPRRGCGPAAPGLPEWLAWVSGASSAEAAAAIPQADPEE